jgi:hypothetical protein
VTPPLLPSAPTGVVRHDPAPADLPPPTGAPVEPRGDATDPGGDDEDG